MTYLARNTVKCTAVLDVPYKEARVYNGTQLSPTLCGITGVDMYPSSPNSLTPLHPSNYRFSPLAALQRDEPGWCSSKPEPAKSVMGRCSTIYVNIAIYFSSSITSFGTLLKYFVRFVLIVISF
jgi:hypothetical protein